MYVEKEGDSLKVSHSQNSWEYYPLSELSSAEPIFQQGVSRHKYDDLARVWMRFSDGRTLKIEMQDVDNQPTWSATASGVDNAVKDINKWAADATIYPSQTITSADGAVSGDFHTIVPLEGTVDLTTCTPLNSDYPDLGGETIDKYTYGRWTDIEVASGTLVAYSF